MCCFSQPTASVCSKGEAIMSPNIKLGIQYRQLFFLTSNGVDERNWSYPATPIRFLLLDDRPTRWETAVVNFILSGAVAAHARCHQSPTGRFPGLKQATAPVGESPGPNRNVAMSFYLFFVNGRQHTNFVVQLVEISPKFSQALPFPCFWGLQPRGCLLWVEK